MDNVLVKEVEIEEVVKLGSEIVEFWEVYGEKYFTDRYAWKKKLIIVAYIDWEAAWYIVWYEKETDGSFYWWMAWVSVNHRRQWVLTHLMKYQDKWAINEWYKKLKITTRNTRRNMLGYLVKSWFNFTEVISWEDAIENRIHLEKGLI